jgi:hypothetical protein
MHDEVILGNVVSTGPGQNIARQALTVSVAATTRMLGRAVAGAPEARSREP